MKKMKSRFQLGIAGWLLIGLIFLLVGSMFVYRGQQRTQAGLASTVTRGNCLADGCLMVDNLEYPAAVLPKEVQSSLNEAINDEYKALTAYQKVTEKLGMIRPFSMIMGAEEQHIASLKAIFEKYGLVIPQNNWSGKITSPSTVKEACQMGVDAEIANASMYKDKLLPVVSSYPDITAVFTSLMNASEQMHLPAFEKCN